jgi:uncharacterized protein CbrC (UPF0167 family)
VMLSTHRYCRKDSQGVLFRKPMYCNAERANDTASKPLCCADTSASCRYGFIFSQKAQFFIADWERADSGGLNRWVD